MGNRYWVGATDSWNGTAASKWSLTSGGAGGEAEPTSADDVFFDANSGANTITVDTTTAIAKSITFTGFTGTFAGSTAIDIYGSLTAVAGMTWTWSGTLTAKLTVGTATITSAGKTICGNCTLNGAGGTLTFADAFVTTGTCTLTAGTWNDGNVNLTMAAFSAAGSTTRAITYGTTNTWFVTGSGTVYDGGGAGLTTNGGTRLAAAITVLDFTYSGASSRTFKGNTDNATNALVRVSAGSGTFTLDSALNAGGSIVVRGLNLAGFSGTLASYLNGASGALYLLGNVTLAATCAYTNTGSGTEWMALLGGTDAGATHTITCNGGSTPAAVTWKFRDASAGGTLVLGGDFISAGALDIGTTYAVASFNASNFNVTCSTFTSSSALTRTITMGSGTWTLTSTAATTVWNMATTTGLTLNADTATIDLTGVTASTRTLTSNSVLMPKLKISAGSGAVTCTNGNYNGIEMTSGYTGTFANQTISFRGDVTLGANATYTAGANAWTYVGTSGAATFNSNGKTVDWPITVNGIGGTLAQAANLAMGATRTLTLTRGTFNSAGFTNNVTAVLMNGTAGTTTLSSGGTSWACNLTCNGASGTLTFGDAFVTTGTCTLTAGTWNDGNVNLTMAAFSAAGSSTRVIVLGASVHAWYLTASSGTVWDGGGANASMSISSNARMELTANTSSTRTIVGSDSTWSFVFPAIFVSAGFGTVSLTATGTGNQVICAGLNLTGFAGAFNTHNNFSSSYSAFTVTGGASSAVVFAAITVTNTGSAVMWQFDHAGTFTSNGVVFPSTINNIWLRRCTLTDDFYCVGRVYLGLYDSGTGGIFNTAGFSMTALQYDSSSTATRTVTLGASTLTATSTGTVTVWNMATTTGLTLNANTATIVLSGVTASTRTISANSVQLPSIAVNAGSGAVTFTNVNCDSLTFGNSYSGTIANQTITIRGSLTLSNHASFTLTAGANAWTFAATSGTKTITSQGKTADFPMTFNGTGGTWQLADALTLSASRTITHTAGTLDLNNQTCSVGIFNTSGSTARALTFGSGTLICSSTGVVFTCATSTNLTLTPGTGTIKLTDSSATARSISVNNVALPSVWVSAGTSATTFTNVASILDLNFTGMGAGTWTGGSSALSIGGSLTFIAAMTVSYTGALTFNATSSGKTITSAGKTIAASSVLFNGVGGVWTLQDALTLSNTAVTITAGSLNSNGQSTNIATLLVNNTTGTVTLTSGATTWTTAITQNGVGGTFQLGDALTATSITLTNGTLNTNSVAVSTSSFSSSNSNTREIQLGSTTWTLSGAGTPWNCATGTNLTVTPGTSTIKMTNSTATFDGGSKTYNNIWFNSASGTYNVKGSNTFKDLKVAA